VTGATNKHPEREIRKNRRSPDRFDALAMALSSLDCGGSRICAKLIFGFLLYILSGG
jgi:hypothetical protein